MATDGTSNVYVVGVAWLAKVNPQGRLLWKRGLTAIDASGVATDRSGNVYISGSICGSGGIDCGVGVAKYNSAGRMLWTRQHGKSPDFSVGIATDRAGNVYISGSTCGFVGIDCDVWVAKYDSAGRMLWTRQLGGTAGFASASGVAADSAGNVYLTGSTDHSFGGAYLGGYRDAWLIKADVAGRVRWRRQIGTQGSDSGGGVAIDPVGGVYLTGGTDGSFAGANFGGAADAWVAKYDAAGRQMWKQQIGTANYESANGIATGATGNLYLVGNAFVTLPEHGDVWLAKFPTRRWSALTAPNDRAGEAQLFGVGEAGEPK